MANRNTSSLKTRFKPSQDGRLQKTGKLSMLAASILLSSNAFALGLGTLEVSSNLDQPLSGRIELNVQPSDDLSGLTAVIAPRSDFDTLGLEYPEYLKDIGIIVDQLDSTPALVITSNGVVIKEPFINFLVRVEWAGGSFLREYTALIDPPVYAAETPQSIAEPQLVGTDETISAPPAFTDQASPEVSDIVDETVDDQEVASEDESEGNGNFYADESYASDNDVNETIEQQGEEVSQTSIPTDAQYGPILPGESLSMIAQELQGQFPDLSIYQIMKVLFDENPNAFIDNNINGLIKGSLLTVGDLEAIRAVDVEESRTFFQDQVAAWDNVDFGSSGSSTDSISVDDDSYNFDSQTDTSTAFESDTSQDDSFQVGSSSDVNELISADQSGNREGEVLALRDQITNLEASLASSNLENQELTERISILEGQLSDLNRLVDLGVENAGLAQVEASLAEQNADTTEVLSDVDDSIDEFLNDTDSAQETVSEDLDSLLADIGDGTEDAVDDLGGSIDEFLSDDSATSEFDDSVTEDIGTIEELGEFDDGIDDSIAPVTEPVEESVSTPSADTSSSSSAAAESGGIISKLFDSLKSSGFWKIVGGVGALLAAAFALLFFRRRRADEEFEVSMLSIESNSQTISSSQSSASAASMSTTQSASVASVNENPDKETSFLTVYSDSDAVVQADEVDPVAEADVYIAYGRDEQAEEVLLDGVASHPERADIKHKLLTLYHKSSNVEGFERIAEELYSSGAASSEMWQEVVQMGQDVSPSNPLFNLSGTDIVMAEDMNSEISIEGEDVNEVLTSADGLEAGANDDVKLEDDDNLVAFETVDTGNDQIVEALSNDDSIELVSFEDGGSETSELDQGEIDALEVDLNDGAGLASTDDADNVVQLVAEDEDEGLSMDAPSELTYTENDTEDEEGERSLREVQEVSDLEIDEDYDESRTQYELAKVFVDLGDEDGAKRILNELVANDDNDEAVLSDARELLKSIS